MKIARRNSMLCRKWISTVFLSVFLNHLLIIFLGFLILPAAISFIMWSASISIAPKIRIKIAFGFMLHEISEYKNAKIKLIKICFSQFIFSLALLLS